MRKDEDNTCRLVLFILNIAMGVIRSLIEKKFLKNKTISFKEHLNNNAHTFFHAWLCRKLCCRCFTHSISSKQSLLTKEQFDKLFLAETAKCKQYNRKEGTDCSCCIAANDKASLESLDITLAYCVMKCSIQSVTGLGNIERTSLFDWMSVIKDQRNKIFHITSSTKLSDVKFNKYWQKLKGATLGIANQIGAEFANATTKKISFLKCKKLCLQDTDQNHTVLSQCAIDLSLTMHQLCEERFSAELNKTGFSKSFVEFQKDIDLSKTDVLFTKTDNISIHILKYPDVSAMQAMQTEVTFENTHTETMDVLLQVSAPDSWDEYAILEMIRRMCKQINEGGNIIIKETTLDNFFIITEILRKTLFDKELLTTAIRDLMDRIFKICQIDTCEPAEVSLSMETLENKKAIDQNVCVSKDVKCLSNEIQRLELIKRLTIQRGKNSFITGCAMTNDGEKYFFIDSNNWMLVIYNNTVEDSLTLKLTKKPWGLALINNTNLIISHPDDQVIQIIDINKPKETDFRQMPGKCYSLTAKEKNIFLVYVEELGLYQYNISTLENKSISIHLPNFVPRSDEIDIYRARLCHTDRSNNGILCYKINGELLWSYSHNDMGTRPTALAFDALNNVVVVDFLKSHLISVSSNGKSHKILLTKEDKIKLPTSVCCCQAIGQVLIANRDDGHVAIYKIQYEDL